MISHLFGRNLIIESAKVDIDDHDDRERATDGQLWAWVAKGLRNFTDFSVDAPRVTEFVQLMWVFGELRNGAWTSETEREGDEVKSLGNGLEN